MTRLYRKIGGIAVVVLAIALVLGCVTAATSGRSAEPTAAPVPAEERPSALAATGRKLFLDNCAHCHGADARGDDGPDLRTTQVSDEEIADRITRGVPHEMPSFAKKLHAPEIAALTAYIRSLR